jgi:hypothetical protein
MMCSIAYSHLKSWPDHHPRPVFSVNSYQYSYDGKTHAYEALNGVEAFLNFVAGIIEETGFDGVQDQFQNVDAFLISAGVNTAFWSKDK